MAFSAIVILDLIFFHIPKRYMTSGANVKTAVKGYVPQENIARDFPVVKDGDIDRTSFNYSDYREAYKEITKRIEKILEKSKCKQITNWSTERFLNFTEEFIKNKMNYTTKIDNENGGNYFQSPYQLVQNDYRGDCDDYAIYLACVGRKVGMNTEVALGSNAFGGHAWIKLYNGEKWKDLGSTGYNYCDSCIQKRFSDGYVATNSSEI